MIRLKIVAVLAFFGVWVFARDKGDEEEKPTLTVMVKPDRQKVRANATFELKLRVVNSSSSPQSIRVMNCSWDEHWKSSNAMVTWQSWDCTKNFEVTVAGTRGSL